MFFLKSVDKVLRVFIKAANELVEIAEEQEALVNRFSEEVTKAKTEAAKARRVAKRLQELLEE